MPTVYYNAINARGYYALIVPQRAALTLGASRVKYRDLVLVVKSFLRGKRERSVFRNILCVAQVVLQEEASVRKRAIAGRNSGKANDCSTDAKCYRRANNRNAGDVRSSSPAPCSSADDASLCRCRRLCEGCYRVGGTGRNEVLEGEGLIPIGRANRQLLGIAAVLQ